VISGMGIVSAAGWSQEEVWAAIEEERSGLGPLTLFPSPRCGHVRVGEVKGRLTHRGSRTDGLAVYAARQAFAEAGLDSLSREARERVAIALGTTTGGMLDTEVFLQGILREHRMDLRLLRHHECASPANAIARALGLGGFRATVSTACASGATAIALGCDLLESGQADIVLAGGADSLTRLTLNGFCSLLNVAPEGCRPFDAQRGGMSLGEGAGILVLEKEESAVARGANIRGRIAGWGSTCDAYHVTAPTPDGSGARQAMALALQRAGMRPEQVDYVNAHGTGTWENDEAEARAIVQLFDRRLPLVSSTKAFFGHTLAAAGAIEAIVCILALERQRAPANLGLRCADPRIGFAPVPHTQQARIEAAMSNSLGFGGNNCSLILCRPDPGRGQRQ
jgi:3-oxoacyl-(acyl-carrier-protein) synthase